MVPRLEPHDRRHRAPRARGARRAGSGCCSRARRPPSSTSTTARIRSSRRRNPIAGGVCTGAGRRAARDRARRRRRQGVHHPRRQRVRSPPSCSRATRSATCSSTAAHEFGTNTGRRRRPGWLDLVMLRHAVRLNTLHRDRDHQARRARRRSTELKVCVAYEGDDGTRYDHVPYHQSVLHKVRPVYETLPGWQRDIDDARSGSRTCRRRRATTCASSRSSPACPCRFVGVGPGRDQTVVLPRAA